MYNMNIILLILIYFIVELYLLKHRKSNFYLNKIIKYKVAITDFKSWYFISATSVLVIFYY